MSDDPIIAESARLAHSPITDPNKIFCECGNMSLAQLTAHICDDCEDVYTQCPKCLHVEEVWNDR